ncbi:prenyltransferase/squalene oxidase repeat-containing protein [Streptomyces syringium]|uniref:prenyltransferase/squalene oxidase repeat-containing protein n=1 Tax=Streptomyces syringium TaxID=76729 RepID=UPI0033B45CE9
MTTTPAKKADRQAREAACRAAQYLAARVRPDGSIHAPCESRVLESALALRLLEAHEIGPNAQQLRAFLTAARRRSDASRLDMVLAAAALRLPVPEEAHLAEKITNGIDHFTAGRKRVLLETVLYAVGATGEVTPPPPEIFDAGDLQIWKQAEMTACKVILAHALGKHEEWIRQDDLRLLASLLRPDRIWEGNILVHLLVLSALHHFPGYQQQTRDGLTAILAAQRHDGGFTLCPDMNVTLTGLAATALAEADADQDLLQRMNNWIAARQDPTGGWVYSATTTQTDVETTAFVMEALHTVSPRTYSAQLRRGCTYLQRMQNPDGGVPNYQPSNPSETSITGETVTILSAQPRYTVPVQRAVYFIIDQQHADGGFALNWSASDTNVILRACHGMQNAITHGRLQPPLEQAARHAIHRSTAFLRNRQNPDGGWGQQPGQPSDPTSTAFALSTLGITHPDHDTAVRGATYLYNAQGPDGAFTAPPDTYSPRFIPIDFKPLPTIYALRALTHTLKALGEEAGVPLREECPPSFPPPDVPARPGRQDHSRRDRRDR